MKSHIPKSEGLVLMSIDEFVSAYTQEEVTPKDIAEMTEFSKWFGREVLYMSFIRI